MSDLVEAPLTSSVVTTLAVDHRRRHYGAHQHGSGYQDCENRVEHVPRIPTRTQGHAFLGHVGGPEVRLVRGPPGLLMAGASIPEAGAGRSENQNPNSNRTF
jgi:hypothetical protein